VHCVWCRHAHTANGGTRFKERGSYAAAVHAQQHELRTRVAPQLASSLVAARARGVHVIWRSSTPVCHPLQSVSGWGPTYGTINALLRESDHTVHEVVARAGVPVVDVARIDEIALRTECAAGNATCRCAFYSNDRTRLHPSPQLAAAHVERLLDGNVCSR
jgi:hypothetical protein